MIDLQKLHQVTMEDKYSRTNIRERIYADLTDTVEPELIKILCTCDDAIKEYLKGDYYTSKNKRIKYLKHNSIISVRELLIEMLMVVVPVEGPL